MESEFIFKEANVKFSKPFYYLVLGFTKDGPRKVATRDNAKHEKNTKISFGII